MNALEALGIRVPEVHWSRWMAWLQEFVVPRAIESAGAVLAAGALYLLIRRVGLAVERRLNARASRGVGAAIAGLVRGGLLVSTAVWAVWRLVGIWGLPWAGELVVPAWVIGLAFPGSRFASDLLQIFERRVARQGEVSLNAAALPVVHKILRAIVITIVAMMALQQAGFEIGPILGSAGLLGLAVSFAAQDTLSNLVAGILLIVDRPFQVGDRIELWDTPDGLAPWGDVMEIGLRATKIRNPDNIVIVIPNNEIMQRDIINYTAAGRYSRVRVPIRIHVDADAALAKKLILRVAREIPGVMAKPSPKVVGQGFGEASIDLEVGVWVENVRRRHVVADQITERLGLLLDEHGIQLADAEREDDAPAASAPGFGSLLPADEASGEGASVRLAAGEGATHFSMRRFTLEESPASPIVTSADQEHYVLRGRARTTIDDVTREVGASDVVHLPRGVRHSYEVTEAPFEFLCLISNRPPKP
jgi:small-conductance mechanosensitive channel/quercetin dioxygenase-like cupin family protein